MRVLVLLAHPDPKSLNAAIARVAVRTLRRLVHQVDFHDLYQERFDPVLRSEELGPGPTTDPRIAAYGRELAAAAGVVIIHPNWWGQPPAILKGWVDRVMRTGVAYAFEPGGQGQGIPRGLLKIRRALVLNTSDTPAKREARTFQDPLQTLWENCILRFCGVQQVKRKVFRVVVTSTPGERADWLRQVEALVQQVFPRTARPKPSTRKAARAH